MDLETKSLRCLEVEAKVTGSTLWKTPAGPQSLRSTCSILSPEWLDFNGRPGLLTEQSEVGRNRNGGTGRGRKKVPEQGLLADRLHDNINPHLSHFWYLLLSFQFVRAM